MVLNLFIFFFVSFSLLSTFHPGRRAQLEVTLPRAAAGRLPGSESLLVVTVARDGRCILDSRVVPKSRLKAELMRIAGGRPGLAILVQADESAPCRSLVAVFDAGRAAGVERMNFAVQPAGG